MTRSMLRDRRGQDPMSATTVNYIAILAVFLVVMIITAGLILTLKRASNFEACQKSISIAHANYGIGKAITEGEDRYSLDCVANHIVMTKDDVKDSQTLDDAVNRLIAGEMVQCWRMVGEGEFNPFGGQIVREFCLICSVIDFDKKFKQEYPRTAGLYEYLESTSETIDEMETTYAEFLPDGWNEPEKVDDTVDTSEPYVVFWWAKRIFGNFPTPPTYVGFKPYSEMVEDRCEFIVN